MVTKTTENAIQALLYLCRQDPDRIVPIQEISQHLDASPSYLIKVVSHLTKAGLVRSFRGIQGGVRLGAAPDAITLRQIVDACQGITPEPYCQTPATSQAQLCGFHLAMLDVRSSFLQALGRWTLADVGAKPFGANTQGPLDACHMQFASRLAALSEAQIQS
jgi:Rrf2 family transcriptional regulator, nitric oxide-sensitive transcriptional repressor